MPIFGADYLVALDIARDPTPFFLTGLFQVVVLFAVAFGVALVVGEVCCFRVGVPAIGPALFHGVFLFVPISRIEVAQTLNILYFVLDVLLGIAWF